MHAAIVTRGLSGKRSFNTPVNKQKGKHINTAIVTKVLLRKVI